MDLIHESLTTSPQAETTTPPVLVRLAGDNRPPNAGRLEIYYNGVWGTVCHHYFDNNDAQVACSMLGFERSGLYLGNYFGCGSGQIWLDNVRCNGSETSLAECSRHSGWGVHKCTHGEDVSVLCYNTSCSSSCPECQTVGNTDITNLYSNLVAGYLHRDQLQTFCSAWNKCSGNLQDIDLLRHLCTSVYPDYEVFQQCFQTGNLYQCMMIYREHAYSPFNYRPSSDCWLESVVTSCRAELLQQSCNTSTVHSMLIAALYADRLSSRWYSFYCSFRSCSMDVNELINNVTVQVDQCDVNSYSYCAAQRPVLRHVSSLRMKLLYDKYLASPASLQSYCSRWNDFTSCINTTGCTLEDIYQYRLSLGTWYNYYQQVYNSSSSVYSFICASIEEYRSIYHCHSVHSWDLCYDINSLEVRYYDDCMRWLHWAACNYNSLKIDCNETTANFYLQFEYQLHQSLPWCDSTASQLMNTSLREQITADSDCSEFRYFLCLTQSRLLQDVFFGRENDYSSLLEQMNVSRTDILPLCMELNNLTTCVGCSPEDPNFPVNLLCLKVRSWYGHDPVSPVHLHRLCNGSSELTLTGPERSLSDAICPTTAAPNTVVLTEKTSSYETTLSDIRSPSTAAQNTAMLPEKTSSYETTLSDVRPATTVAPNTAVPPEKTSVDSVRPLYGPVSGGTRVTITGQFLNVSTVTAVYFGQHQGLVDKHSAEENTVFATTPPVNETARHLAIELVLNDGSRINTNHTFEYRGNPVFADIRPRDHLAVGGTEVTVTGSNLDSVAEPRITLTVVITRFYDDMDATTSKNEIDSEPCELPQANANGSEMLCRMPEVILPDDLNQQLEKNGSEKARHRRTYTEGPGVAVYVSSDGRVRADVYIGLKLDGFTRYQNISSVDPDIKMQFALPPTILCKSDNLDFDPSKRQFISIKGRHLRRGCREVDYDIRLGVAVCVLVSLTDNQVDCRPPTGRPDTHVNHTFCHGGMLSLQLMIGNAKYHCYCVNYVPRDNAALIACLTVGIVLLFIIFIAVILYCRRESKLTRQEVSKNNTKTSTHLNIEDKHYSRQLSSDEKESRDMNVFDNQYSKKLPDDQGEESEA